MKFVDIADISVKAGDGGDGHISFRREKFVPKGGPDGGNGGKGGDVIVRVEPNLNTLLDFRYRRDYKAEQGKPGGKSGKTGKNGDSVTIVVPQGTLIIDNFSDSLIVDLKEPYQEYVVARGGNGGRGNAEFTSPTRQTPRFAEPGWPGEEKDIRLELKLLADVGIVGLPNVGKSTLISVISAAKPKIADYPFTTLVPNIGVVGIGDYKSYTVADIPGLIEGASDGKGLGIQFLRHIERTKVLLFMIDATSQTPAEDYKILMKELTKYKPGLKKLRRILCFSKCDSLLPDELTALAKVKFTGVKKADILQISSVTNSNLDKLKYMLWDCLNEKPADE